jgi:hypothetical protein
MPEALLLPFGRPVAGGAVADETSGGSARRPGKMSGSHSIAAPSIVDAAGLLNTWRVPLALAKGSTRHNSSGRDHAQGQRGARDAKNQFNGTAPEILEACWSEP